MKSLDNKFFVVLLLAALVAAIPGTALASDWSSFQNNETNCGITADEAPIDGGYLANWSARLTSSSWCGLEAAPVVGDNKVYEVAYNGEVYAYYLNGTEVWTNTNIGGSGTFEIATPAYNDKDKLLYVALSRGNASTHAEIHALYTSNGTEKWANESLGDYQTNTPITYANDRVFFGTAHMADWSNSDAGDYYCFNASSGDLVWKRSSTTSSGYYWAGAAVIGDYLVYGDDAGHVVSVEWNNFTNGEVWKEDEIDISDANVFGFSGKIRSSICYSEEEGRIYFAVNTGHTCAVGFNKNTGKFDTSDKDSADVGYTSTPAVYNGRVYVGAGNFSDGAKLYCLNASNLTDEKWSYTGSSGGVQGSPAISTHEDNGNGEVYIYFTNNGPSGSLYCLMDDPSKTSAEHIWTVTPSTATYTMQGPSISNGYVFFGNDAGYLYGVYSN